MQIVYRLLVFLLGIVGAAAALGINTFYSISRRFQDVVGLHPDPSHGWLGLGCAILAFIGACFVLFRALIPFGALLLIIAGIGFFFVVNWWAWLASPQMFIAAFFALYYWWQERRTHALETGLHRERRRERPPPETGAPAVG